MTFITVTLFVSLILGGVVGAMYGGILGYFLLLVNAILALDIIVTGAYTAGKKKMADETLKTINDGLEQMKTKQSEDAQKVIDRFGTTSKTDWEAQKSTRASYEKSLARSILNKDIPREDDSK